MKLSISNIIWDKGEENLLSFLDLCFQYKLDAVELALSCFWEEPISVSKRRLTWLRDELSKRELEISALHSITFTRSDLEFFKDKSSKSKLLDYLDKYSEIARFLGTSIIVFGSPNSRKTYHLTEDKCEYIMLETLEQIDRSFKDIYFSIEPLSKNICDYINTFKDAADLLKNKQFKNIKIQLDVRTLIENNEPIDEIQKYKKFIVHCQVSNPGLTIPGKMYQSFHRNVFRELKAINYQGFITAEVKKHPLEAPNLYAINCIKSLKELYL